MYQCLEALERKLAEGKPLPSSEEGFDDLLKELSALQKEKNDKTPAVEELLKTLEEVDGLSDVMETQCFEEERTDLGKRWGRVKDEVSSNDLSLTCMYVRMYVRMYAYMNTYSRTVAMVTEVLAFVCTSPLAGKLIQSWLQWFGASVQHCPIHICMYNTYMCVCVYVCSATSYVRMCVCTLCVEKVVVC